MIMKTIHAIGDLLAQHSAFRATHRDLARLNHRELRDIGLDGCSIVAVAYEAGEQTVANRRAARGEKLTQRHGTVSEYKTLTA